MDIRPSPPNASDACWRFRVYGNFATSCLRLSDRWSKLFCSISDGRGLLARPCYPFPMPTHESMDVEPLISRRSRGVDASGIRRVFELGAKLKDPYNFSIGQPDFPVPEPIKQAAIDAIRADRN